jgi:predicted AAA+ superfamily ATPase
VALNAIIVQRGKKDMVIKRFLEVPIQDLATQFPVVAILGPRQSGKTTLARMVFKDHIYLSFEDLDIREFAINDPRGFLEKYRNPHGMILDEFQHAPDILSYIQTYVDLEKPRGYFILTGSQNFLVNQAISQSLAGRIAITTLLPLSIAELAQAQLLPSRIEELVYRGSYPSIHANLVRPNDWYPGYLLTYLERDVRQITNIGDLSTFKTFMQLCAGRIGQLLNYTQLANDCGISVSTAMRWLSALEASYIIQLVQPHHKNFSKRVVKTPKLYFYDTGLACSLLGIESTEQVDSHYLRGGLIESFIITDFTKQFYNSKRQPHIYFWRDSRGQEVDCLIERRDELIPIEIKGGKTPSGHYFDSLTSWGNIAGTIPAGPFVVYAGADTQKRSIGTILSWHDAGNLIEELFGKKD